MSKQIDRWAATRALIKLRNQAPPLKPIETTENHFPLSLSQERLWAMEQLNPEQPLFNLPYAFQLNGPLDIPTLNRALETLITRQPVLRTTFRVINGQLRQVVQPIRPFQLQPIDLSGQPTEQVRATIIAELNRPFNLTQKPPFRVRLYSLGQDEYVIGLTVHHIIYDYWSESLFFKELNHCYGAYLNQTELTLKPLPVHYTDYAAWQRKWLTQPEVLEFFLGYWYPQLQGLHQPDLPVENGSTKGTSREMAQLPVSLSAEAVKTLKRIAKQNKVQLFTVLLTALKLAIAEQLKTSDVAVFSPVTNRHRPELQHLMGDFSNLLVLRTDLAGNPTLKELLSRVGQTISGAIAHQDMPLQLLQTAISFKLPQISFSYLNTPQKKLDLPGLAIESWDLTSGTDDFEILLFMMEHQGQLTGTLKYNRSLFTEATITGLLEQFQATLARLVEAPTEPINLPFATEATPLAQVTEPDITALANRLRNSVQNQPPTTARELSAPAVKGWLLEWLEARLQQSPATIDPQIPFSEYGVSSLLAVNLIGDLSRWAGRYIEPVALWSYPTIDDLVAHLTQPNRAAIEQPTPAPSHKNSPPQTDDPIAIIGFSCRYPQQIDSPAKFWELLKNRGDTVTEVPAYRWDMAQFYDSNRSTPGKMYVRYGSFLGDDQTKQFDPLFFGLSPLEATALDPQQRLLIELSWEVLEHAGIAADKIRESRTGILIGNLWDGYSAINFYTSSPQQLDTYLTTSNMRSMQAGRLAYILGVHGPTYQLDTACSSSLLALHLACQSLRHQEADMMLVGGVDLNLAPNRTIGLCQMQALSPDGRSKAFSAEADGFGQGEGGVMVALKRLSDAVRDGDNILALVRGSAVNHDGPSNGLTAPNSLAQESMLRAALQNARLAPHDIQYIEAHGTGTKLGDPVEVGALRQVFAPGRTQPLLIGSVKSNVGHTSGAAGLTSLLKVVLSMQHGEIPASIHAETLNPLIPWADLPFTIPQEQTPWPAGDGPHRAGISSFGMSGTNVHVIVEQAPVIQPAVADTPEIDPTSRERAAHTLTLSGKTEPALKAQVNRYLDYFQHHPHLNLADVCYTANTGRVHFQHRLAVVAKSVAELQTKLSDHQQGKPTAGLITGQAGQPKIAFMMTGQGSQYPNMGRELYETQPLFRQIIDQCAEILQPHMDTPLLELLYPSPTETEKQAEKIKQTRYTQPALFATEYALARLWQSWGVQPTVLMGHSVGEYVAACLAGVFSLEDGLKLIATRGRLMQSLPKNGAMVSVTADETTVQEQIEGHQHQVSIAAINAPNNVVISGEQQAVQQIVAQLTERGIAAKSLDVSHAFHSPLMQPILAEFEQVAQTITYHKPQLTLISNLSGAERTTISADYWVQHLRQPVQFRAGVARLAELGVDTFVEIGPKPTLLGLGQQTLAQAQRALWLPSLYPKRLSDWEQMLESVAQLHAYGVGVDWSAIDRPYLRQKVHLPTYPFQRKPYWFEPRPERTVTSPGPAAHHPLLGELRQSPTSREVSFQTVISSQTPAYLDDHKILGQSIFPGTAFLEMALSAGRKLFDTVGFSVKNVLFQQPLKLEAEATTLQMVLTPHQDGTGYQWQVFSQTAPASDWQLHCRGELVEAAYLLPPGYQLAEIQQRCKTERPVAEHYLARSKAGLEYGPAFQLVTNLYQGEGELLGLVQLDETLQVQAGDYQLHPALLDAGLHISTNLEEIGLAEGKMPFALNQLTLYETTPQQKLWSYIRLAEHDDPQIDQLNITLFADSGAVVADLSGLAIRPIKPQAILGSTLRTDWLYRMAWHAHPRPSVSPYQTEPGRWLIVAATGDTRVSPLAQRFEQQGSAVDCLVPNSAPFTDLDFTGYQGVIYLAPTVVEDDVDTLPERVLTLSRHLLALLQAIINQQARPRVWLVTTQAVGDDVAHPAQGALWGFARTVMWEHPELQCSCLDITPQTNPETVFNTIWFADEENQIISRSDGRSVARLTRYQPQTKPDLPIKPNRGYLVVGGLGGLGLKVAEYLAQQGATHIILTGRRGAESAAAQTAIRQLEDGGAQVLAIKANVSELADVTRLIEASQQFAPLAGIINSAAVVDDGILLQQTPARFANVLAPKVAGSWYLHQATQEIPLDFSVYFSSITSLLGNGGQTNYGAANGFMDSLAAYRQARGLKSLSINWGGWSEVGLGKTLDLVKDGEGISPTEGVELFGALLTQDIPQAGVIPFSWQWLETQLPAPIPAFSALIKARATVTHQSTGLPQQLAQLSPEARFERLKQYLQIELELVTGILPTDEQSFFEIGLDSLMSIQLTNRISSALDVSLPATLLINNGSLTNLTSAILDKMGPGNGHQQGEALIIKPTTPADVFQIVELLKSIQITETNLSEKLDESHPNRYARTGGFFDIFSADELQALIDNPQYLVLSVFHKGKLVAYILLVVDPAGAYQKWQSYRESLEVPNQTAVAETEAKLQQHKMAYAYEIAISPAYQVGNITSQIYKTVIDTFIQRGFTHAFAETYNIVVKGREYDNPNSALTQNLLNTDIIGQVSKDFYVGPEKITVKSHIHIVKFNGINGHQ